MEFPNLQIDIARHCNEKQQEAVEHLLISRGGIAWWKVGGGKTRIGLFWFARLQNIHKWALPSICLIVCKRRAFYDWTEEIKLIFGDASVYQDELPAHPPGDQPVFLLVSNGMLTPTNVARLQTNGLIRVVIFDESWMYANNKSKRSKAARKLSVGKFSLGLSGTIMKARDTIEPFCQLMVVHREKHVATNITTFRDKFQVTRSDFGFPQFFPKPGAYKEIMRLMEPVSHTYFPKGNRAIHEQFHTIPATPQQRRYFKELKNLYSIEELDLELDNALVIGIKAQQIANGWTKDGSGKIVHIESQKPEKLQDELHDIIASGERAIVWCAFRYDVEYLKAYLDMPTVKMLGGEDFDVFKWNDDPTVRVCLATEASGVSVNHFTNTPYAIYYSSSYRWLDMQQSRGRTDRVSSKHSTCFYKYLQVAGSIDSHVYRTALDSGNREQSLIYLAGLKSWLKLE